MWCCKSWVQLTSVSVVVVRSSLQIVLDSRANPAAWDKIQQARRLKALGDEFTDDMPGEVAHPELEPRLRPGQLLRLVYKDEYKMWHALKSSVPPHPVRRWRGSCALTTATCSATTLTEHTLRV